ncbi:MAG: MlaD family protein [Deltaproteobacteria bacterium]|jgi:ABC-type transporter Mla subunit MlaD|nr:MlaD family protein [Deltaproteobacteria bacterium]
MSKETNYFKIGLFTISAFLVLAAGVIFFGLSSAFRPTLRCVTFFDHSVQGLSVGAPVNFRGFKVGQVSTIGLPGLSGTSGQKMVEVDFFLFPALLSGNENTSVIEARRYLEAEIDQGLRVYLTFQGVSGVSFLDLDYQPEIDRGPKTHPRFKTTLLMIPNAPGTVMEISESFSRIVRSFRAVDFDRLGQKLDLTLTNFSLLAATLNDKTSQVSDDLRLTLQTLQATGANINKLTENLTSQTDDLNIQARLDELGETLRKAKAVLARTDQMLKNSQDSLRPVLDNFKTMTDNLRDFSETAKRYPSQIIFGQPPKEVHPR